MFNNVNKNYTFCVIVYNVCMAKISERLRELRKERKLSQSEVAEMLSLSLTAYNRYELGSAEPNIANMIKLIKFYDVSADYLVGLTDIKYKSEFVKILEKLDPETQKHLVEIVKKLK